MNQLRRHATDFGFGQLSCAISRETKAKCSDEPQLGRLAIVLEDLEKLSVRVLRNDTELSFGLEIFNHLNDIGVRKVGQDAYLLPQALQVLLRLAVLRDKFHGYGVRRASERVR